MIRVQMPAINTPKRQKNARLVVVKTQAEADELVAQGGVIIPKGEEPPEIEPIVGAAPPPAEFPEPRAGAPRAEPEVTTTAKATKKDHK